MKIFLFVVALLTLSESAWARTGSLLCHSVDKIFSEVKDCAQNSYFSRASEACLNRIELDVKAYQAALAHSMAERNAVAASSQTAKIENNSANLSQMQEALAALITEATVARGELSNYAENLMWPGYLTTKVVKQLKLDSFLGDFSCYKNHREAIQKDMALLDQKIVELRKAQSASLALGNTDSTNLQKMNSTQPNLRVPAGLKAQGPIVKKKKGAPASSITGIEEEKRKSAP